MYIVTPAIDMFCRERVLCDPNFRSKYKISGKNSGALANKRKFITQF